MGAETTFNIFLKSVLWTVDSSKQTCQQPKNKCHKSSGQWQAQVHKVKESETVKQLGLISSKVSSSSLLNESLLQ